MLFNSSEYLFFFLASLTLAWLVVGFPRLRLWILLIASYYFYIANNHWLIILIVISTQIDYVAGCVIGRTNRPEVRKLALIVSMVSNLALLGTFKYFNFFASTLVGIANLFGLRLDWVDLHIVLPVGISFYTFQSMSYTIDVYRGELPSAPAWHRCAFSGAFFPQLIAGPIVRAADFLPQIPHRPQLDRAALENSLYLIMRGLLKKIVLADFLAQYADLAYNTPEAVNLAGAWIGVYAFTFQVYFDFSGYSDIAIGSSRLIGFHLIDNFRRPYAATDLADYWRRWHISLSTWLRDYLFISLGGSRMRTRAGVYRNLMITMVLGGLWHGAAMHFVLWGLLHGVLLGLERALGLALPRDYANRGNARLMLRRIIVFNINALGMMLFRSPSMPLLAELCRALMPGPGTITVTLGMLICAGIIAAGWLAQNLGEYIDFGGRFQRLPTFLKGLVYSAAFILIMIFNATGPQPFIYFQF